jgi:hypothetical protein
MVGVAAPRIATALQGKGGRLATVPEGFTVTGKEGPLKEGEMERAIAWGKEIAAGAEKPIAADVA